MKPFLPRLLLVIATALVGHASAKLNEPKHREAFAIDYSNKPWQNTPLTCTPGPSYCCVASDCGNPYFSSCDAHSCVAIAVLSFRLNWSGELTKLQLEVETPSGHVYKFLDQYKQVFEEEVVNYSYTQYGPYTDMICIERIFFPSMQNTPKGTYKFRVYNIDRTVNDNWELFAFINGQQVAKKVGHTDLGQYSEWFSVQYS